MSNEQTKLTLDSFPDIKQTLKRGFINYIDFLKYLKDSEAPQEKEEFNNFVCNLYVTDDMFALVALANEHAQANSITRSEIMDIAFTCLYNDYMNICEA